MFMQMHTATHDFLACQSIVTATPPLLPVYKPYLGGTRFDDINACLGSSSRGGIQ